MNTKHNYNEAKEIEEALPIEGFNVVLSLDEEYFKLMFNGVPVCADSANEDLYTVEGAQSEFEWLLGKITQPVRWCGVVAEAIKRGFRFNNTDLDQVLLEAEMFIIKEVPFEERRVEIVPEFWENQKSLTWCDEDGQICVQSWGEIVSDDWKGRSYYRIQNRKIVEKVSHWLSDEEDVFCYLDVVVTTKGEVVNLFA